MTRLTELYRPKTVDELVLTRDMKDKIQKICSNLTQNKPVLLVGEPGIGKTTICYILAKILKHHVVETNASDVRNKSKLQAYLRKVQQVSFVKTLYLFDEVDGLDRGGETIFEQILKKSVHPIIMTANDEWKISSRIKKIYARYRIYRPNLTAILDKIKEISTKEGLKPAYNKMTMRDVRNCINTAFYGGIAYETEDVFEDVRNTFLKKKLPDKLDRKSMMWLLDNVCSFYRGRDLYEAIQVLALVSHTGDIKLLQNLPKSSNSSARVRYPYYFSRLKAFRTQPKNS